MERHTQSQRPENVNHGDLGGTGRYLGTEGGVLSILLLRQLGQNQDRFSNGRHPGTPLPLIKAFFLSEPRCNLMISVDRKATPLLQP